jgi:hypothetical protein
MNILIICIKIHILYNFNTNNMDPHLKSENSTVSKAFTPTKYNEVF